MTRTRKLATLGILGLAGTLVAGGLILSSRPADAVVQPQPPPKPDPRTIQVAVLLDTSGSMDGLIDQAKSQLWRIVNELSSAQRQGAATRVEIALYEYGKQTIPAADGFVRQILPFTTDLDRVSEELFALRTNGGDEYCGRAIHEATRGLEWSHDPRDLKLIFIAGNEPFDQGDVDYRQALAGAREKGITVNVVHCSGSEEAGWREAAALGRGEYLVIDHNRRVVSVDAPQDAELGRLSSEINSTYLPYGPGGRRARERQEAQDANAVAVKQGAAAERTLSKASAAYRNADWDLVDAVDDGRFDLDKAKADELPPALAGLSAAERKARVAEAAAKRKAIQARIRELSKERADFVAAELARRGEEGGDTLDRAIISAVRAQAESQGYGFVKK